MFLEKLIMSKLVTQILSSSYLRSVLLGLILGILLTISYVVGFASHDLIIPLEVDTNQNSTSKYEILDEVQNLVSNVYVRDLPSETELEYSAIRGMLSSLNDPATFFIDPPVAQSESHALAGTYGGIGVMVNRIESGEFALFPFEDGPSYAIGIRDNDVLISINDVPVAASLTIDEVDQLLRGEVIENNGVTVEVRNLSGQISEFFIEFAVINIPSVISRIAVDEANIGYLQILKFTSRTPEELEAQLSDLEEADISALIIDLRNNSGGLLVESIEVADYFLDNGTIVIEKSRNEEEIFTATEGSHFSNIPIVILVNNRTASASELVAGALRDNGRGVLIGQKTFGKGTVQQIFPLKDGSSIHVTSAEWLTPNEESIASNGLQPDISLIPDENGRDIEYGEAIRYLHTVLEKQSK